VPPSPTWRRCAARRRDGTGSRSSSASPTARASWSKWIHEARHRQAAGIILNAAAYTHTSIAILDAITAAQVPTIEVHITNVHAREEFRHHSYVSKAAKAVLCGFGIDGYGLAIDGLAAMTKAKRS